MIPINKILFLFLFLVFVPRLLNAQQFIQQTGLSNFQNYTVQDGLVESTIEFVKQDSKGYIWICTHGGLSKFDGTKFENFSMADGLPSNYVSSMVEGPDGKIWIGTHEGVATFDGNKFKIYTTKDGLYHNQIWRLVFDKKGNLYIATSKGINILKTNGKIEPFFQNNSTGPDFNVIRSLYFDSNQHLWFGTNNGLYQHIDGKEKLIISEAMVFDFCEELDGTLWFCSWSGTLFSYSNNKLTRYSIGTPINSIELDKLGNIWLATWDKGIMKFDKKDFHVFNSTNGLAINSVWGMAIDSENNIWCGTFGGGLSCLRNQSFTTFTEKNGLGNNAILQMCKSPNKNIWLATGGGISKFNPSNGTFLNFTEKDGLGNGKVTGITSQKNGVIWASRYSGPTLIKIIDDKLQPETVAAGGFTMYTDNNDTIWIGTDGGGAIKIVNDKAIHFTFEGHSNINRIVGFLNDKKNNQWVIPYVGNLLVLDKGKKLVFNKKNGFVNQQIYSICEDDNDALWISTAQMLYRAKYSNQKLTLVDSFSSRKYFNNQIFAASYFDKETNSLWITTSTGVYNFDLSTYYKNKIILLRSFNKDNGYLGSECSGILKTDDNNLWFSTATGLVRYNPLLDNQPNTAPYIHIISLKLFLKDPNWKELGVTKFTGNLPINLSLNHSQNHITFLFQGISHSSPKLITYKYKLVGFEKNWSPVQKVNEISYSNLAPGNYEFQVMACNANNIWSKSTSYKFIIQPAFWQTIWFKILAFILILVFIFVFVKWRTKKLNKVNKLLENKVNLRTQALKIANIELEEKNKDITDSLNYAKQIQKTILPSEQIFQAYFKGHFIMYIPRDIVSGDFYWFNEIDDTIIFAVADCTGHGVPGAMVSLVCSNALNKVVKELKITEPGKILDSVSTFVEETFKSQHGNLKDGMDISLVTLNLKTKKLLYAGANNPILICGNINYSTENSKINKLKENFFELKADKQPIGVFAARKEFNTIEISWTNSITLYMFSDGYADQFGGPKGKKFKYTHLHDELYKMSAQPMKNQKDMIESTFTKWKGWPIEGTIREIEQLDDICIVGIKI